MALDKELAKTMAERSDWQGSPDRLWANVAQAISGPAPVASPAPPQAPTQAPSRRPAWRVPAWAAAAALMMLAAGTWALRPGTVPHVTPPVPPPVTQPGAPIPEPPGPYKGLTDSAREPYVLGAHIAIIPAKDSFAPGEPVRLTVRVWNDSQAAPHQLADTVPQLFITPAAVLSEPGQQATATISVPELAGRRLAPGEVIATGVTWNGSSAVPGWYWASLGRVVRGLSGNPPGSRGGGGRAFFVEYPPGAAKTGTIESGASNTVHDITLTVRKVEFTDRHTQVQFHLSTLRAPANFGIALERSPGLAGVVLGMTRNDSPEGGIDGVAEFDPTPAGADSITMVVPVVIGVPGGDDPDRLTGPWRVTVPLK